MQNESVDQQSQKVIQIDGDGMQGQNTIFEDSATKKIKNSASATSPSKF